MEPARPKPKPILIIAIGALIAVGAAGCDANENADLANGRYLFKTKCGICHTLAEANTNATVGPDLDSAFAASRQAGMDEDTIEGVVADQIAHPRQTDPTNPTYMPPQIVTGTDAEDVSSYVASVAGVPGIQPPEAPGGPGGQVFADQGCGSCHTLAAAESSGTTGPNLDDTIAAWSPKEIEEAIVDPEAEIASGFEAGIMPTTYGTDIEPKDLKLLVDFLAKSAGQQGGGNQSGR